MKLLIILALSNVMARPDVSMLHYLPPHEDAGGGRGVDSLLGRGVGGSEDALGEGGEVETPGSSFPSGTGDSSSQSFQPDENSAEEGQNGPVKYEFHYDVKDDTTGTFFGHQEMREGDLAQGTYNVVLPDGRKQIVDYEADTEGYKPKVRYEGNGITDGGFSPGEQSEQGELEAQGLPGLAEEQNNGPNEVLSNPTELDYRDSPVSGPSKNGNVFDETGANRKAPGQNGGHDGYPSGRPESSLNGYSNAGSVKHPGSNGAGSGYPAGATTNGNHQVDGGPRGKGQSLSQNGGHKGYPSGRPQSSLNGHRNGDFLKPSGSNGASSGYPSGPTSYGDNQEGGAPRGNGNVPGQNERHNGYPSGRPQNSLNGQRKGDFVQPSVSNGAGSGYPSGPTTNGVHQEGGGPRDNKNVPGQIGGHNGYPSGRPQNSLNGHRNGGSVKPSGLNGVDSGYPSGPSANGNHEVAGVRQGNGNAPGQNAANGYPSGRPQNSLNGHRNGGFVQHSSLNGASSGYPSGPTINGIHQGGVRLQGNENVPGQNGGHNGYPSGRPQSSLNGHRNGGSVKPAGLNGVNSGYPSDSSTNGNHQVAGAPQVNGNVPGQNGGHNGYPSGRPQSSLNSNGVSLLPSGSNGVASNYPTGPTANGNYQAEDGPRANGNVLGQSSGQNGYPSGRPEISLNGHHNGGSLHPSVLNGGAYGYPSGPTTNGNHQVGGGQRSNGNVPGQTSKDAGYPSGKPESLLNNHNGAVGRPTVSGGTDSGYPSGPATKSNHHVGHISGGNGQKAGPVGYPSGKPNGVGLSHPNDLSANAPGSNGGNNGYSQGPIRNGHHLPGGNNAHPGYPSEKPNGFINSQPIGSPEHHTGAKGETHQFPSGASSYENNRETGIPKQNGHVPSGRNGHPGYPSGIPNVPGNGHPSGSTLLHNAPKNLGAGYPPGPSASANHVDGSSESNNLTAGHPGYPSGRPSGTENGHPNGINGHITSPTGGNAEYPSGSRLNGNNYGTGAKGNGHISSHPGYSSGKPNVVESEQSGNGQSPGIRAGGYPSGRPSGISSDHGLAGGLKPSQDLSSHPGYPSERSGPGGNGIVKESTSPRKPQGSGNGDLSEDGYHY